jgi:hypothetical protein
MGALELSAHLTVRQGCLEGSKRQAAELIRITKEKDTRTLVSQHGWKRVRGSGSLHRPGRADRAQHACPRSAYEAVPGLRRQSLHDRVRRTIAAAARSVQGALSRIQVVRFPSGF